MISGTDEFVAQRANFFVAPTEPQVGNRLAELSGLSGIRVVAVQVLSYRSDDYLDVLTYFLPAESITGLISHQPV